MIKSIFMDTWSFLALAHRQDNHHQTVVEIYQNLRREKYFFYTTDYVLDELITLLFRRSPGHEAVLFADGLQLGAAQGTLIIEQITTERFAFAWSLRKKFQDKPRISFTDLTSMVVMNELKIKMVFTDDEHFLHIGMGLEKIPRL